MKNILSQINNQKGIFPLIPLILIAAVGIIGFLFISSSAPIRNNLFSSLYPKSASLASTSPFETYSADLTPVAGTGSSGSGKYTFKLYCQPETSGSFVGQYMVVPMTSSPDTFVTNLLGNPYNAHIHYTSSSAPMRGIITPDDPPPGPIPPVNWLSQLIMPDKVTLAPALSQSERDEVRFQPATGRPGTWVNIHTNACPTCQAGELQGDVKRISGDCSATPTSPPNSLPGDINNSGKVDIFDYNQLLTDFGKVQSGLVSDLDNNGKVDIFDYNILLTNFGRTAPTSTPASTAVPQGLVGYWKMDESSGNATDSSGNGNTLLSTNGASFAPGKFGNAGNFLASGNQFFSIADASQTGLEGLNVFTMSAWINPAALYSSHPIMQKSGTNGQVGFEWDAQANQTITFAFTTGGGYYSAPCSNNQASSTVLSSNTWTQLTITYDGSTLRLYKNGVEHIGGSFPYPAPGCSIANTQAPFSIGGGSQNGTNQYFDGKIDEARVYNRVLSPTEISDLYNLTSP